MKIYYNFNVSPFCHARLNTMVVERPLGDFDDHGNTPAYAHCSNQEYHQFNWRFILEPLWAEAVPIDENHGLAEFHQLNVNRKQKPSES